MEEDRKVEVIIVSRGELANVLLNTAKRIVPRTFPWIRAVTFDWDTEMEDMKKRLKEEVERIVNDGKEVLILVDLFGSSEANAALSLTRKNVGVVSGVNLPMVLSIMCSRLIDLNMEELAFIVMQKGRSSIVYHNLKRGVTG